MTDVSISVPDTHAVWSISVTPQRGEVLPLRNCPVTNGHGYLVAVLQDVVVCLKDGDDGLRVVWEYAVGSVIPGSPASAPDGSLRVHAEDGRLHGISVAGEPLWAPVEIGEPLNWATPQIDSAGVTWVSGYSGGLIKVEADGTTSKRAFLRSPSKFDCTGLLHRGLLYVGGEDHFVHAIDTGGKRGKSMWNQAADQGRTGWFVNSAVAMDGDKSIVVAGRDEHLYGLSLDGVQQWKSKAPGQMLGSPVIDAEGRVFVGVTSGEQGQSAGGRLACFDIRRRQWLWLASANGPVESTPVVGNDGVVYFGDNAGWVHAVDAKGNPLWRLRTGAAVRSSGTIVNTGRVVFGDDAGRLVALQCTSDSVGSGWPQFRGSLGWTLPDTDQLAGLECVDSRADIQIPFDCEVKTRPKIPPMPTGSVSLPAQPIPLPVPDPSINTGTATGRDLSAIENEPRVDHVAEVQATRRPDSEQFVQSHHKPETLVPAARAAAPLVIAPRNDAPTVSAPQDHSRDSRPEGSLSGIADFATGKELLALNHHPWQLARLEQLDQKVLFLSNGGPGYLSVTVRSIGTGVTLSPNTPIKISPGGRRFVVVNIEPSAADWILLEFETRHSQVGRRTTLRLVRNQ